MVSSSSSSSQHVIVDLTQDDSETETEMEISKKHHIKENNQDSGSNKRIRIDS